MLNIRPRLTMALDRTRAPNGVRVAIGRPVELPWTAAASQRALIAAPVLARYVA